MTASWEDVFPSSPIAGETAATVELVGEDWRADRDWDEFVHACNDAARAMQNDAGEWHEYVNPNRVRTMLTGQHGLTIEPRRYSAFWHRASKGKDAFLVADGCVENTDRKGGNAGKPLRRYRLRSP